MVSCKRETSGFSLIELLVVVAILGLLLAATVPAIRSLTTGPSLSSASVTLKSALEQARARALSMNNYVGLFIVDSHGTEEEVLAQYALFEVADLDGGIYKTLNPPRQITAWQFLPKGVIFMKGDRTNLPSILDLPKTANYFGVRGIDGPGYARVTLGIGDAAIDTDLPGIVFGPNGAVAAPRLSGFLQDIDLPLVEGVPTGNDNDWTAQVPAHDERRFDVIRVGRMSGSIRFLQQEEYSK